MGEAKAVFVPTIYLEAFGGVAVEAMLCGTPVITTNFGVFPETVKNGVSGYRCDTLNDFVQATKKVELLNPEKVRAHADRYLMETVKLEYQKWFADLHRLYQSSIDGSVEAWHFVEN